MKILVNCIGFIGDNLFATSVVDKLVTMYNAKVDLHLSIAAPYEIVKYTPNISHVYLPHEHITLEAYDKVFNLSPINRNTTPTRQFQSQCGIPEELQTDEYFLYTNPHTDAVIQHYFNHHQPDTKKIAIQLNWEERSFLFTPEEYERGINVPPFGYGGRRRNINFIVSSIDKLKDVSIIPVGKPANFDQRSFGIETVSEFTLTASIIKNCDYFIGSEGGLSNLAAGIGTNTIITGDFVHQLYGWNGVIEKNKDPKLGPKHMFPYFNHTTLDPYLTDEEVILEIARLITQ